MSLAVRRKACPLIFGWRRAATRGWCWLRSRSTRSSPTRANYPTRLKVTLKDGRTEEAAIRRVALSSFRCRKPRSKRSSCARRMVSERSQRDPRRARASANGRHCAICGRCCGALSSPGAPVFHAMQTSLLALFCHPEYLVVDIEIKRTWRCNAKR